MTLRRIVGLGTGRCGTRSLACLLGFQSGVNVAHERKPVLRWHDEPCPGRHFQVKGSGILADVGFYYLPHVEYLRAEFPGIRFVCLKRDRGQTIRSFVRAARPKEDWFGPARRKGWSGSFPDYPGLAYEEQVGRYWDDYYRTAESLAGDDFRVFPTESLNDDAGVLEILQFVGIEEPDVVSGVRLTD